jgi:hypothetical protein
MRLRRKHARSASTPSGACGECAGQLQTKLAVGSVDDPLEHEADRIADRVMASSALGEVGDAPVRVQRAGGEGTGTTRSAPQSVERTLAGSGRPLEPAVRHEMERRFGCDFFDVRVHTDARSQASARDVSAHAYTSGSHMVFASGRYAPGTREGQRLIAHELAHVVQQRGASAVPTVRRDGDDLLDDLIGDLGDLAKAGEEEVRRQLRALAALPGTGAVFSKSGCPKNFCNPFKNVGQAKQNLFLTAPVLLAGVAKAVDPGVVPLWKDYLLGGSAPQDLTSGFSGDFTASRTTAKTASFIANQMKKEIAANHKGIMGSAASATVDLTPRMTKTLAAIDDQSNSNAMDFNAIGEIPGNIAGGIGKDQVANKIGARPSPFNDSRTASIGAQLTRGAGGITVVPTIDFEIKDTIDLCPGNCGAATEQDATIPMSRFEATGLSGDVPFTVKFPAPAATLSPFVIPLPKTKASPGKAKAPSKPSGVKKKPPPAKKGASAPKGAFLEATEPTEEIVAANAIEDDLDTTEAPTIAGEETAMDDEQDALV